MKLLMKLKDLLRGISVHSSETLYPKIHIFRLIISIQRNKHNRRMVSWWGGESAEIGPLNLTALRD